MEGAESGKSWLAGVFDRAAPTYDRVGHSYHEEFGRRLVERADVFEAASVLDVACGKGAVMVPAAKAVGSAGLVVGIDISSEMTRLARVEMSRLGHANCRALVMDAENLAFEDDSFDLVFCAFGVFFLPDPVRAAAEFARVLRPGGALGLSSWGDEDARWDWEGDLIEGLAVDRRSISQPFDTPESLRDLLTSAGFQDVGVEIEELDVVLADETEWWAWKWSYSLRGLLEQLDGETLERFRSDAFARMRSLKRTAGYPIRLSARFAFGTATTS
jgi:ubiquinone/menaquinone biosynthesis C-methylase UbiE